MSRAVNSWAASTLVAIALLLSSIATQSAVADEGIRPDATMIQHPDVSDQDIVFVYSNDIWRVPRSGGVAVKVASPAGREMYPRFSTDGDRIAFVGNYEGDLDLYTIPATGSGIAHRVTHHPGNEMLCDWMPDGESLIYFAGGTTGLPAQTHLYEVDARGGLPQQMPVPYGANGAVSADGAWLAYTPHTRDNRTWKRYRGGMATDIWLFNLNDGSAERITDWEGTDTLPMWYGQKIYYLSDAGSAHRLNIWEYDTITKKRRQVTNFTEYDVKWPSIGPGGGKGEIVFQNGPKLYLLDLQTEKATPVEVIIPGDRPTLRPKKVDYSDYMQGGSVSATGKRGAVEARGDIWSLPAEKGITRNLTRSNATAERNPIWSPDGRWIAYLSDESGEYEIYIMQSDGKGAARQLTTDGSTYRRLLTFSPDSEMICFSDASGAIYLIDVESGEMTHVATDPWATPQPVSFSHDSAWLTFSLSDDANNHGVVHLYNIETGELHPVTDPMFNTFNPVFDREGKFLYAGSTRRFSPRYSDQDTTFIYDDSQVLMAIPLNLDVENPWLPESDEEEWEEEEEEEETTEDDESEDGDADEQVADDETEQDEQEEQDAEPKSPIEGVWEGMLKGLEALGVPGGEIAFKLTVVQRDDGTFFAQSESMGESSDADEFTFDEASGEIFSKSTEQGMTSIIRGKLDGDTLSGTWEIKEMGISGEWEATRSEEEIDEDISEGDTDEPVEITLEGFERRAMLLPVDPGNFGNLSVNNKNQLIYVRGGDGMPSIKLFDIEDEDEGERNVVSGAFGYDMSGDGKKLGVYGPNGMAIVSAAAGQSLSKPVPTNNMKGMIDPREEWRQMFNEAWRLQRDFFYDAGLHGVDWEAVRQRYGAMVDDCVTREDLSYVIGEMIAELNVGHAYYFGGDTERSTPSENVGMLGCDYQLVETDEGTAYRIEKIYEGAPWDADARGPLSQPGVDVKEGDFLLAVNGIELDTSQDPWAPFTGLAGQITELTVSERPVIDEEDETLRRVLIKPARNERSLRYRAWVESKRKMVDEMTDGRVGYIYVPNTGVQGQNELFRQFYGQRHKDGLIIDERWNGGGQIPTRFIELLNRPRTNYWARRHGNDWPWPPDSHQGPKVMLINGLAGSGGDMFPALFRQAELGPLIGTRTWGGLVGISGNPGLVDGGYMSVPTFGYYETDGSWGIEGHGVDPDIEVIDDPSLMSNGADPQLEKAIEVILRDVQRNPYVAPERPASPDRSGMGITDQDK
jgi:tricorn protease